MYIRKNNLILTIKYIVKLSKFFPFGSIFLSNDSFERSVRGCEDVANLF